MPATSAPIQNDLLRNLLRQVSRSFYLSLKWLPPEVRHPISLAYLLARTSDTIADTDWVPAEQRLRTLEQFAGRVRGDASPPLNLTNLAEGQKDEAEGILLTRSEEALALLDHVRDSDRDLIRRVLDIIISGQTLDLERFAGASADNPVALKTALDLDDYTYRVAGCVGDFWTRICFANLNPRCDVSEEQMVERGIRYGRGLQLINILRDLPRDLRMGRCYLPSEQLKAAGLTPADLLDPQREPALRPIYDDWLSKARAHLAEGWAYTLSYPRRLARIRIACALPILIGQRTLDLLQSQPVLNPEHRVKVPRATVKQLLLKTVLLHPFPGRWQRLGQFGRERLAPGR